MRPHPVDISTQCVSCSKPAVARCWWGTTNIVSQDALMCQEHVDDLWERINSMLQLNMAWFRIDAPSKAPEDINRAAEEFKAEFDRKLEDAYVALLNGSAT